MNLDLISMTTGASAECFIKSLYYHYNFCGNASASLWESSIR